MCEELNGDRLALRRLIDSMSHPALAFDRHLDVVESNQLAAALSGAFTVGSNLAKFTFLNPFVEDTVPGWEETASHTASTLRDALNRHEPDHRYAEVVGELMARSASFADRWATNGQDVSPARAGVSVFDNPIAGSMTLTFNQARLVDDPEHTVLMWFPEDPQSEERLLTLRRRLDPGK